MLRRCFSSVATKSYAVSRNNKPRRKSGVQKEVLGLYKTLLTAAKAKDAKTFASVQKKFRKDAASVTRFEFQRIEHMIRKGQKYVKLLQSDSVKTVK